MSDYKILFLIDHWNEEHREQEYNSSTETWYWKTYDWRTDIRNIFGSSNVMIRKCNKDDFNTSETLAENDAYLDPKAASSGSYFSTNLKSTIRRFSPQVIVVEFGMNAYSYSESTYNPLDAAVDLMETYQEIYNYCYIMGIVMVIVAYEELDYSSLTGVSENYKKYFTKLIEQQQVFAEKKKLRCVNLKSNGTFTTASSYKEGNKLNKYGHIYYRNLLKSAINKSFTKYDANVAKVIEFQQNRPVVYKTTKPTTDKFSFKKLKIAFLNSVYTDPYYDPWYKDNEPTRTGTYRYYWAKLAASRLGNPEWKAFVHKRRPISELIDNYGEEIIEFNPNIIVIESGLFDYNPNMYDNEPSTRVMDIIGYYNKIYNYCVEHKIILIISTYGSLNYEHYLNLNKDDPIFTEGHKRYHSILQEKIIEFCYQNNLICNNVRLNDAFGIESFSSTYLSDGISLSRSGHYAYSECVANAIKLAVENINQNIKDIESADKEATKLTKYYTKIASNKKVNNTVENILRNIAINTDYSQEKKKDLNKIDPVYDNTIAKPTQKATTRILEEKKARELQASNSSTDPIEKTTNITGNNSTDPLDNNFSNIGNILKSVKNNNVTDPSEFFDPAILLAAKESAKSQNHMDLKIQAEQERQQNIQNSITITDEYEGNELRGDGQIDDPEQVVSFEICRMLDKDGDHHCKFMDIQNRCIFDQCIYDTEELPKFTRKWYTKCLICTEVFARDPRYMKAPFCDSCISRMQAAEKLPFNCVNCGKPQNHPSIIMFSGICDYCAQHKLFNTCCLEFKMSPEGINGVDTNHEPVY